MKRFQSLVLASLLACHQVYAGDDDWESPVYRDLYKFPLPIPPTKTPKTSYRNATSGNIIDFYEVEIKPFQQQVYPNLGKARLVGYDGISPGPTFRIEKGRETVVRFINHGDMASAVHLHGSYSRAPFDGWAEDTIPVNSYKDYYYPNSQSGRTLWYHDHAVSHTAENAYFGQAGFYLLHDPAEDAFNLPSGQYDVPLALASKFYKSDGSLVSPAGETDSLWGDVIHVNGQPWPYLKVEPRKYRFRLLDTSVSRAFKLYFQADGSSTRLPFHFIASDAGLMTKPVQNTNIEISMAERWEIVFDFTAYAGKNVTMRNERDVQADEDYNSTDKVMRFVVGTTVSSQAGNGALPTAFKALPFPAGKTGVDHHFKFERTNGEWRINGVAFADVQNRILAKPPRGSTEIWELENSSGGWSHPIHVHLVDFQILSRTDGDRSVLNYEKESLKDVVLLGRGETVRVIARYAPWDGVYMFHCHNLIHEDHDMMAAFNVTSLKNWGYTETTSIVDPMDPRFRAAPYSSAVAQPAAIQSKLATFDALNAYRDVAKVEAALKAFYQNNRRSEPTTFTTAVTAVATPKI